MHELLTNDPGRFMLLLGNEAIVRGAIEAGLAVSAAYPGTPSSEIGNNLFQIAQDPSSDISFEFSTNEKVAMEVTAAASAAGLRTLTSMKHVGMNVASDVLMTLAYMGTKGGMVIVCADDPSLHSSQNEQDNRFYAQMASLPVLEPTSPQEAKDMTMEAFDLSEALELPVILRTTTRTAHVRGPVKLGNIPKTKKTRGHFEKAPMRWVAVPAVARTRHKVLLDQFEKARGLANTSRFNTLSGSGRTGIIATGVSACYVADVLEELHLFDRVRFLRLGFVHPQPRDLVRAFLAGLDQVLVVEELEPFQENAIKVVAQEMGLTLPIFGKASGHIPRLYELTPKIVKEAVCRVLSLDLPSPPLPDLGTLPSLPQRPPSLCKGCPHTETYGVVKEALSRLGLLEKTIFPTDIGCYTLGLLPPIQMADYLLCMGSSIGSSAGFSLSTDQKVVSFIGDSTFFHSGIPSLVNAVHNGHRFSLVILDNGTTAMTGHQPNPGIRLTPPGYSERHPRISIEAIVRACGVRNLAVINPYKKKEAVETVREMLAKDELSVIISEAPCILYLKRMEGKTQKRTQTTEQTQADDKGRDRT